jgi:GTP-binding protein Era
MVTDRAERFLVQEIVREKLLQSLQQEVPHGIAVEAMQMKEREDGSLMDIDVNIYCERKSHKGIVIGKNGEMLKKIGIRARRDIEAMLGTKVNLKLWVKVRSDWRDSGFDPKIWDISKKDIKGTLWRSHTNY